MTTYISRSRPSKFVGTDIGNALLWRSSCRVRPSVGMSGLLNDASSLQEWVQRVL